MLGLVLATATLLDVPYVPQRKDTCAAAALSMVMGYWGHPIPEPEIAAVLLQPELRGIKGSRLAEFARARGFDAIAYASDLEQLRDYVAKGRPLIVALQVKRKRYHDVVVVGFDAERGLVLVHDPAVGSGREIEERDFDKRWSGSDRWTLLVMPRPPETSR